MDKYDIALLAVVGVAAFLVYQVVAGDKLAACQARGCFKYNVLKGECDQCTGLIPSPRYGEIRLDDGSIVQSTVPYLE